MFESMVKYIINDLLGGLAGTQWYHLILLLIISSLTPPPKRVCCVSIMRHAPIPDNHTTIKSN